MRLVQECNIYYIRLIYIDETLPLNMFADLGCRTSDPLSGHVLFSFNIPAYSKEALGLYKTTGRGRGLWKSREADLR